MLKRSEGDQRSSEDAGCLFLLTPAYYVGVFNFFSIYIMC